MGSGQAPSPGPGVGAAPAESEIAGWYRERAAAEGVLAGRARSRSNRIGYLRLLVFAALLLALLWLATAPTHVRAFAAAAALLAAVAFALLVRVHRLARAAATRHDRAREYHELGVHRMLRDWAALPQPVGREVDVPPGHPYAADLDIVGRASLLQLLDVTSRAPGRSTLIGWLLAAAPSAAEVRARQAAAREIAARDELRERLGVLARMSGDVGPRTLERFVEWCESPGWLLRRPALLWAARLLTAVTVGALVLQVVGIVARPLWVLTASLGLFLLLAARSGVSRAVRLAGVPSELLRHHAAMLRLIIQAEWKSPRLQRVRAALGGGGGGGGGGGDGEGASDGDAAHQLARLERIVAFAEVRHSPMLYLLLQWLLVWDVHVAAALESWRRDAGVHVRGWLAALGEAEAMAALGTLAHDNPGWTFPVIDEPAGESERGGAYRGADAIDSTGGATGAGSAMVVEATVLGHPLIPARVRVANDVTVGPPGSFLLVTGSNMSGKSTLLRAIGANVVLALAGAPVCATRFRTPLLAVHTSIRVQDSLEQGISLFMAELQRLREIVDAARAAPSDRRVLYLLDEILHGTNTAERQIAARIVIGHLISAGAIGAVTTHDLSLAAGGELAAAARPVHFSEQFDRSGVDTVMTFDYRLRPGLATSANALALLEMVGLSNHDG